MIKIIFDKDNINSIYVRKYIKKYIRKINETITEVDVRARIEDVNKKLNLFLFEDNFNIIIDFLESKFKIISKKL